MGMPSVYELMAGCMAYLASDGRSDSLVGDGWQHAAEAFLMFAPSFDAPQLYVDLPLVGDPRCDVHVGFSELSSCDGGVPRALPARLDDLLDWAAKTGNARNLLFPVDAGTATGEVSGVYLRHAGNLAAARRFLKLCGICGLAEAYREVARRLPEAWGPVYAGNYSGRGVEQVRMELVSCPDHTRALASSEVELRQRLQQAGYAWVRDDLLEACMRLVALGLPASLQFDVRADATLSPTLALTVSFEKLPHRASEPFSAACREVLRLFAELGVADDRCRRLDDVCLARNVRAQDGSGAVRAFALSSLPACAKLKWEAGELATAKWYQVIRAHLLPND